MSAAALIALPLALLLRHRARAIRRRQDGAGGAAAPRPLRPLPPSARSAAPQIEVVRKYRTWTWNPRTMLDDEPEEDVEVRPIGDALGPGKTILVGMPGAFLDDPTRTCRAT